MGPCTVCGTPALEMNRTPVCIDHFAVVIEPGVCRQPVNPFMAVPPCNGRPSRYFGGLLDAGRSHPDSWRFCFDL